VLCYLTDKDAISFLKRCAAALDEDCGYIVLKENTCEDELFVVDVDDASLTRSVEYWQDLIFRAGLRVIQIQMQGDFPDEIYPVPMMALRPW
jgi:protein N-terminal methyltransferase